MSINCWPHERPPVSNGKTKQTRKTVRDIISTGNVARTVGRNSLTTVWKIQSRGNMNKMKIKKRKKYATKKTVNVLIEAKILLFHDAGVRSPYRFRAARKRRFFFIR